MSAGLTPSESARAALIGAIAISQDRTAFIALFEFYAPRIKAQAMRFGLSPSVAEDVVQDAMLAVWRRASQFDATRGSASAWIFTIATHARIDRMRRDRHMANAADIDTQSSLLVAPDTHEPDAARLADVVSSLPAEQRRIVELSFYSDIPHAEIAARLDIPLGTVKSRIRLAISKLRIALGDLS